MLGAGWGSDRCLDWQHADGPQEREARGHHPQQHGQLLNLFNHDQPCPDQSCRAANGPALGNPGSMCILPCPICSCPAMCFAVSCWHGGLELNSLCTRAYTWQQILAYYMPPVRIMFGHRLFAHVQFTQCCMFRHATWCCLTMSCMTFLFKHCSFRRKKAVVGQMHRCKQWFALAGPSDKHEVGPKQQRDPGVGQSYSTASGQAHHARC